MSPTSQTCTGFPKRGEFRLGELGDNKALKSSLKFKCLNISMDTWKEEHHEVRMEV
jgi:hypothetical protein